ncbi:MAG TPA: DMT family transporter [Trebonia sp.]|nr:DMT family transporter [Trebonia sp.]
MRTFDTRVAAAMTAVSLWSTNAVTARYVLARTDVAWLLLLEAGSASVVLGTVALCCRVPVAWRRRPEAIGIAVVGLAGTMTLQYLAYALAPLVAANALTYVWPLAAAGWFAVRRRSRATALRGGCASVGFAGVLLTMVSSQRAATGSHPMLGLGCAVASAACMAGYTLGADRAVPADGSAPAAVAGVLLPATVTAVLIGGGWVIASGADPPPPDVWAVAGFMGAGQMAAGYGLWSHAMTGDGAVRLAGLGYATPLLSTVLLLAVGESASTPALAGVGLVLASSIGLLLVGQHPTGQ